MPRIDRRRLNPHFAPAQPAGGERQPRATRPAAFPHAGAERRGLGDIQWRRASARCRRTSMARAITGGAARLRYRQSSVAGDTVAPRVCAMVRLGSNDRENDRGGGLASRGDAPPRGPLAILPGPCDWSRPACSKDPTSTGSSRWSSWSSPSAGDGRSTASAIPARHALVQLGAAVPARDWPDGVAAVVAWIRRLRRRRRRGAPRPGGPSFVRPGALDRDLSVAGRRASADDCRGRLRARRARGLAVANGPPDRGPGAAARSLAGAPGRGPGDAADVDPRRRPPDPDRVDLRDQRQEHGHPADHPHPAAGGTARRDDHLRRRPGRRADGRPGRLDRTGWRAPDPRPARHRRRRARDRPGRDRPARRRLRVERRERPDQRLVRPPRPPGDPHAARAGRGQGDDLPDHASGRLGRAQRRRPAGPRGRAPRPGPGRAVQPRGRTVAGGPPPPRRAAGAPTWSATA